MSHLGRRQRGFTLFEVLIVLAMIAIATGIAMPSLRQWTQRNRLQNLESGLQRLIQEGRRASCQDGITRFLRIDPARRELVIETHHASNTKSTAASLATPQSGPSDPLRRLALPVGSVVTFHDLESQQNLDRISLPANGLMEPIGVTIQTTGGLRREWAVHRYTGVLQLPRHSAIP